MVPTGSGARFRSGWRGAGMGRPRRGIQELDLVTVERVSPDISEWPRYRLHANVGLGARKILEVGRIRYQRLVGWRVVFVLDGSLEPGCDIQSQAKIFLLAED